jgi:hypothetical protein
MKNKILTTILLDKKILFIEIKMLEKNKKDYTLFLK